VTRLLLDANVSPALAAALRWRGHDAVHVNDLGLRSAPDEEIFRTAVALGRAVVTHDGDYLRLLRDGAARPSVIHLTQRELQRDPVVGRLAQALALGDALRLHGDRLEGGAAVRVDRAGSRVEPLPLAPHGPEPPHRAGLKPPHRRGPGPPHRAGPAAPLQRERVRDLPGPAPPAR
jgi:predicted nuclease of predicted toxin-antitoxin system